MVSLSALLQLLQDFGGDIADQYLCHDYRMISEC